MDLSIKKLQQVLALTRCGSFSRAAVELNMSQPSLSRSIAAIEEHYGFPLFNRVGHGVELTAAGSQVIAQAEPLLQMLRTFDSNLRLFGAGKSGTLSLGLSPLLASQLLSRFTRPFFSPETKIELRVTIRPGNELLDQLKNDAIELFFFPESHIQPGPDLDVEMVGSVQSVCVVRHDHPLADRPVVSSGDLPAYPWASAIDPPFTEQVLGPARLICDNYHILREAVIKGDFVCICSRAFVARQLADGTLKVIDVEGLPLTKATPIYAARLRGRLSSPLAQQALAHMKVLLQSDGKE